MAAAAAAAAAAAPPRSGGHTEPQLCLLRQPRRAAAVAPQLQHARQAVDRDVRFWRLPESRAFCTAASPRPLRRGQWQGVGGHSPRRRRPWRRSRPRSRRRGWRRCWITRRGFGGGHCGHAGGHRGGGERRWVGVEATRRSGRDRQ